MARLCGHARNLAQETVRKRTGVASIENLRIETFTQVRSRRGQNLQQVPGTSWAADAAPGCPERGCVWTKLGRRVARLLGVCGLAEEAQTRSSACETPDSNVTEGRATPKTVES